MLAVLRLVCEWWFQVAQPNLDVELARLSLLCVGGRCLSNLFGCIIRVYSCRSGLTGKNKFSKKNAIISGLISEVEIAASG